MSRFSHKKYMEEEVEVVELISDTTRLKIAVGLGNTLFSCRRHGTELLYFPFSLNEYKNSTKLGGNPFMHPWANRLEGDHVMVDGIKHTFPEELYPLIYRDGNGLPLHGLLLKADRWRTEAIEETESFICHHAVLEFDDPDWLRIFPFPHTLDMKTFLHEDEICIEVDVYNSGDRPMPLSFGFHPYFLIDPDSPDELELNIPLKNVLTVNDQMIPTGELESKENIWPFENDEIRLGKYQFDHGFTGQERKRFYHLKQDKREFDLYLDDDYDYVQLYAPNQPEKPYVCIEPMLAPTNALNTGACKMLEPGGFITQEFTISFYDEQFKS